MEDPTMPARRAGDDHGHPLLEHRITQMELQLGRALTEIRAAVIKLARGEEVFQMLQNDVREIKGSITGLHAALGNDKGNTLEWFKVIMFFIFLLMFGLGMLAVLKSAGWLS